MIRPSSVALGFVAAIALLVGACNSTPPGPALTDPKEILTAALKSTEAAKSVHLDVTVDGKATVKLPGSSGAGTTVDLAGHHGVGRHRLRQARRQGDLLCEGRRAHGRGRDHRHRRQDLHEDDADRPALHGIGRVRGAGRPEQCRRPDGRPRRRAAQGRRARLVKGEDVACGSEQCYTVSTTLSADELGLSGPARAPWPACRST